VPRSKQPRRYQAAEKTRGPPGGRTYQGGGVLPLSANASHVLRLLRTRAFRSRPRDTDEPGGLGASDQRAACETPLGTPGAKGPDLFGIVRKDDARERTFSSKLHAGKGMVLAWSLEEKALVAPFAVELRHLIRRLAKHRALTWMTSRHLGRVEAPRWRAR
jgi:hypothetical protein